MLTNILLLSDTGFKIYIAFCYIFLSLVFLAAVGAILVVMLQKSNSDGIQGITASSETFFGKNRGKSLDSQLKKWTWICLGVLAFLAIAIYIVNLLVP